MEFNEVMDKVRDIVADQLGVDDKTKIAATTSLMKDLEADSLDAVEIMMSLEDEFGVEIPDEEAEKFQNIGDIATYITNNK